MTMYFLALQKPGNVINDDQLIPIFPIKEWIKNVMEQELP